MSISQRKHVRLTIDIPVFRYTRMNERVEITLFQISIGGCLIEWDDSIKIDEEFRLEIQLPNKNWLPLSCVALYIAEGDSVGIKFQDITQFEQELIVEIMSKTLANDGIPMKIDPFSMPKMFVDNESNQNG